MKKKISISASLIFLFLLSSCSHSYYLPNIHNVPLFKEKEEARISLNSSGGNTISAFELQSAYAITNHIGVMLNYMSAKGGSESPGSNFGKGNYYETAVGYYKPINKQFVFEIYGGGGISSQHHQYINTYIGGNSYTGTSDLSFTKLFIQPAIGLTTKAIDIALSARLSNLSFYNINNQINTGSSYYNDVAQIANNKSSMLFEPALTIRAGWKNIKLQLQIQSSNNWSNPNLQFENSNASIGLWFAFSTKQKAEIKKN